MSRPVAIFSTEHRPRYGLLYLNIDGAEVVGSKEEADVRAAAEAARAALGEWCDKVAYDDDGDAWVWIKKPRSSNRGGAGLTEDIRRHHVPTGRDAAKALLRGRGYLLRRS